VQASLTGNRENVYHAVAVGPLTAAECALDQTRAMTDELFAAHHDLLPTELRAANR
jgi:alpha-galactosidase